MFNFFIYKYICLLACVLQDTESYDMISCGVENTNHTIARMPLVGTADIERFPWMGLLFYPVGNKRFTTFVILVTRQMVIASAIEIDKFPKENFRNNTKVIVGQKCRKRKEIGVRDYTYHPEYSKNTYSALALVQLEADHTAELHPICPPPNYFIKPSFFAITLTGECEKGKVKTYKMKFVDLKECKLFYAKTGLDVNSFWPSHTTCARALSGVRCLWRSGTALVVKQGHHWRLVGVGIYGPGCKAPSRFLDYGMYHQWMLQSVRRVGYPAITRVDTGHIIVRRKMSNVQRYGLCDDEEKAELLYRDQINVNTRSHVGNVIYNLTLISQYEYKCVILKAEYTKKKKHQKITKINLINMGMKTIPTITQTAKEVTPKPKIYLRRWCTNSSSICQDPLFNEIHFYVEIVFNYDTTFAVYCYGSTPEIIDPKAVVKYGNGQVTYPSLPSYESEILPYLKLKQKTSTNVWFYDDNLPTAITTQPTAITTRPTTSPPADAGVVTPGKKTPPTTTSPTTKKKPGGSAFQWESRHK